MKRQRIFITGASRGLGLSLARNLEKTGLFHIILSARLESLPLLEKRFKGNSHVELVELDLRNPSQIQSVCQKVNDEGGVDILINNAAVIYRGVVEQVLDQEEKELFQTNYFSHRELIKSFLPLMKKNGGKIINISSVGGMMSMPTMSSYSASKFALEGMSEALYYELKPFNIQVNIVQIGFLHSESFQRTLMPVAARQNEDPSYKEYYQGMKHFIGTLMLNRLNNNTPENISKKVINKLILNNYSGLRYLATLDAHFFSFWRRFVPRRIYHAFLYLFLPHKIRKVLKFFSSTTED